MRLLYFILILAVIFYLLSSIAMTLPYSPWSKVDYFISFIIPSLISIVIFLMSIFFKNKKTGKTPWMKFVSDAGSWKELMNGIFIVIICPPAFFFMLAFSMHRWPAYATYAFANKTIDTYLYCVEKKNYAKESRGLVVLKLKYSDEEYLKLPWPKGEAPRCPGFVHVSGKKGFFGVYFTDVK